MASDADLPRGPELQQNEVLGPHQTESAAHCPSMQSVVFGGNGVNTLGAAVTDQSLASSLIAEYETRQQELTLQLKFHQDQLKEIKIQLESVIKENGRLHKELREAVEKQLCDTDVGGDIYADDETVRSLQEQLQAANQANQHLVKMITEQSTEMRRLEERLREAKSYLRSATARVNELTRTTGALQEQMQEKEGDVASALGREDASDRRLQQLQSSIRQLEARLCVALKDADQLRAEKTRLEQQCTDLQARCQELEAKSVEATRRARANLQLLEEAGLQRNQALLEEKHKEEDRERMREAIDRIVQDAAARTRKEVVFVKKQYNAQLSQMMGELSALQMECAEKQSQIDRAVRERRAVEEELEKTCRQGLAADGLPGRLEEMLERWQRAERAKDELQLQLRAARSKAKQLDVHSSEEISRCRELIETLQSELDSERENCGSLSEQRLRLQQENEHLQRESEELRRAALDAQKKAKLKISSMEHEFSAKAHGLGAQLRELEDRSRNSTMELQRLLAAQQKAAGRWREEARRLSEDAQARIGKLKSELSRQKRLAQDLTAQLEAAKEKALEDQHLLLEQQEKADRLQARLRQAEQRAATAAQQLSVVTTQRRRAASLVGLDTV